MSSVPRFDEMPYRRPNLADIEARERERLGAWETATSARAQEELVLAWDRDRIELDTLRSLAQVRFELDTRDPARKAASAAAGRPVRRNSAPSATCAEPRSGMRRSASRRAASASATSPDPSRASPRLRCSPACSGNRDKPASAASAASR